MWYGRYQPISTITKKWILQHEMAKDAFEVQTACSQCQEPQYRRTIIWSQTTEL